MSASPLGTSCVSSSGARRRPGVGKVDFLRGVSFGKRASTFHNFSQFKGGSNLPTKPKAHNAAQLKERRRAYERARGSASAHGYGTKKWNETRRRIFIRDLYACQLCGKQLGIMRGDCHCDHKQPRPRTAGREHIPGIDDEANLQVLCASCHSKKTRREA